MLAGQVQNRTGSLEPPLVLGVVDDVLADPLLPASAQVDDGRAPDEVGGDGLLEPLQLVRVDARPADPRPGSTCSSPARVSAVSELTDFGLVVLVVSGAFLAALAAHKLTEFFPVPPPALFLVAAAVASDIWPGLSKLSTVDVERIAVVALVVILFDGGMQVGWPSFRESIVPISVLGLVGTFATAGVMTVFAHTLFGFDWTTAGILGAAVAPTDPAVMFSVLGRPRDRRPQRDDPGGRVRRERPGRDRADDRDARLRDAATTGRFWTVVREFAVEMSVGLAIGLRRRGAARSRLCGGCSLPSEALYPLRALAGRRHDLRRRGGRSRIRVPGRLRRRPRA